MDRGVWQAAIHGLARVGHDLVTKSAKRLDMVGVVCLLGTGR